MPTIFVPFVNLSFNSGKLNSQGLVQADGVIHNGAGYLTPPPMFVPTDGDFDDLDDAADDPSFGHVNLNQANSSDFSIYFYSSGKLFRIDVSGDPPWTISACGTVTALEAGEGGFVSFGPNELFAGGHSNHLQLRLDGGTDFIACFTSDDKPKPKYVSAIGNRILIANCANTGTAGDPDPNRSLIWWGYTDNVQLIGEALAYPEGNTDFEPKDDDYGDIVGLTNGRLSASIFKDRAVYEMDLGGAFGFEFNRISTRYGLKYPRSIAELADDDYFFSQSGPAVVRSGQVILLGDGFWTARGLELEGPPDASFNVLGSAVDEENGLVFWLLKYQTYDYTYSETNDIPAETIGTAATTYALLCYNPVSNQFSFAWKVRAATGVPMIDETDPTNPVDFRPICLVDRIPWNNRLQAAGVGMLAVQSGQAPRLFLTGLSGASYTPEWTVGQDAIFTTGMIPILSPANVAVTGVRPVIRSRRGFTKPQMKVRVRTAMTPWEVERLHPNDGSYFTTQDSRTGWIGTTGVHAGLFVSIELTISARTAGTPVAYSYLLNEIEGVEVEFAEKQGARRR